MNYSYTINCTCEGNLRNVDPIKNYSLFLILYTKAHTPILVPIENLQCVELGDTKCMCGHTFNFLYRDWMLDKLANREPTPEGTQIFNHLLALQPNCISKLYPRALATCLAREKEFLDFFRDAENWAPDIEFIFRT